LDSKIDKKIQKLLEYVHKSKAKHIFLRVGYEFDNPDFDYDNPVVYKRAFRKLVDTCRRHQVCRHETAFVWHSWAAGITNYSLSDYYPGDDYVDWVGISLFQQFYSNDTGGSLEDVRPVLDFARQHNKPIMIAESTPFGGIDQLQDPWNEWFQPALNLIEEHDIAMWSYINCDWNAQPMWRGIGFNNTRLAVNATVMRLWQEHVLENPRFLNRLKCGHDLMVPETDFVRAAFLPFDNLFVILPLYYLLIVTLVALVILCARMVCPSLAFEEQEPRSMERQTTRQSSDRTPLHHNPAASYGTSASS
jgi:hypothetical protein